MAGFKKMEAAAARRATPLRVGPGAPRGKTWTARGGGGRVARAVKKKARRANAAAPSDVAGRRLSQSPPVAPASVVILQAEVRDEVFAAEVAERVLELHQLDEDVVLGVEAGRGHRRLEVEGEPLLRALHPDALREVEEEREV